MEAYTGFASVYDRFMDNVPYEEWAAYLWELLKAYGIEDGLVLDLGCGTGTMTEALAGRGYDMIGVDNAEDMLQIAMEKREKSGFDILYLLQDMREFELYGTVAAVVSICDSMNYLTDYEELVHTLSLVNNYLDPGGIFIFDLNTLHKYRDVIGDSTIAETRENCCFIWDNVFNEEERINEYDLTLFLEEEDGLYRRFEETHYQKAYTLEEIRQAVAEAGMELEAVYDAFTREGPKEDSERVYVVARERGKVYIDRKEQRMTDYIVRATAAEGQIRGFASTTRELVETARRSHNTSPVATAALGRLLTAGGMMGSMMKGEDDLLTIKIQGDGPIEGLTVTADSRGNVKGYAYNPMVILPANAKGKLDVGGALGVGVLSVIQDIGLKEPYVGQTILVTGEIAEDLTYYYATSEQTPSSVALGVLMNKDNTVKQAGGFIIQLMPGATENVIGNLEAKLKELPSVTSMLDEGLTPELILERLLGDLNLEIMDRLETRFFCNCDKARVEKALISIGRKELQSMIDDGKPVEINCHFCNRNYSFSIPELEELMTKTAR